MRGTKKESHDKALLNSGVSPKKINEFSHSMAKLTFLNKKTFVDKSGPFDRQRELMSLQDSLMPPLKDRCAKPAGFSKPTERPSVLHRKISLFDRGPHEPINGPFRPTTGFSKMTGVPVTKRRYFVLQRGVAVANFLVIHTRPPAAN